MSQEFHQLLEAYREEIKGRVLDKKQHEAEKVKLLKQLAEINDKSGEKK